MYILGFQSSTTPGNKVWHLASLCPASSPSLLSSTQLSRPLTAALVPLFPACTKALAYRAPSGARRPRPLLAGPLNQCFSFFFPHPSFPPTSMAQATSKLWTRRRTSGFSEIPMLSPLYSTALVPTSAFPIDCIPTPPSRPPPSSPALYTPTEAVGILLGQSPLEAAHSTRLAVDSLSANRPLLSPHSERHYTYHSSPCSPLLDHHCCSEATWTGQEGSLYSHHQDEFNFDIDTAALATEVALQVLSSADCFGEPGEAATPRKLRLMLPWDQDKSSADHLVPPSDQAIVDLAEKPIKKGRARMSQEKRKRLARRKEREAMLLGIPPKPVSAPPHISHFPSLPAGQQHRLDHSGWRQPRQAWTQEVRRPSKLCLVRSGSMSEESNSRCSSISAPSLDTDESGTSMSFSPTTSPECNRPPLHPTLRVGFTLPGLDQDHPTKSVPRLALHPPSPQQCRTVAQHRLPVSPYCPQVSANSTSAARTSPPTMRWSTTQGLMTSQGVPVPGPRATTDIFWPKMFSSLNLQPSSSSDTPASPP